MDSRRCADNPRFGDPCSMQPACCGRCNTDGVRYVGAGIGDTSHRSGFQNQSGEKDDEFQVDTHHRHSYGDHRSFRLHKPDSFMDVGGVPAGDIPLYAGDQHNRTGYKHAA